MIRAARPGYFRCRGMDKQARKLVFTCIAGFRSRFSDDPEKNSRLLRYEGLHYVHNPETGHGTIVDLTFHW
jgi:hypothetical protein